MDEEPTADRPLARPNDAEVSAREELAHLFRTSPIPEPDLLEQLSLYSRPQILSHELALADLYRQILGVHGSVFDLGTRYGRTMVTFSSLRRIYEPYNYFRTIVGFDTFAGFPEGSSTPQDGGDDAATRTGTFGVPPGYADHLEDVLRVHEQESPMAHIRRFELRRGDVRQEVATYLDEKPETVVALAYFDLDLYDATREALARILPHTTRGTVLAFDQPTHRTYPGETLALRELVDLRQHTLRRFSYQSHPAYVVLD